MVDIKTGRTDKSGKLSVMHNIFPGFDLEKGRRRNACFYHPQPQCTVMLLVISNPEEKPITRVCFLRSFSSNANPCVLRFAICFDADVIHPLQCVIQPHTEICT